MTIYLNDQPIVISDTPLNLQECLLRYASISQDKKGIAIAVNEEVIPKSEWKNYILKNNDRLLLIIAAQGG